MARKKAEPVKSKAEKAVSRNNKALLDEPSRSREIGGVTCLVLLAVTVLVAMTKEAAIPKLYYNLVCGLVGTSGFYTSPVAFGICGYVLLWNKKKPYKSRVICSVLMVLSMSALIHLFLTSNENLTFRAINTLWNDGIAGTGSGLIGGLLAITLYAGFLSGAYLILIITLIASMMAALNYSLPSLYRAVKNRPRPEPEEDEPEEDGPTPAEKMVDRVTQRQMERKQRKKQELLEAEQEQPEQPEKHRRRKEPMPVMVQEPSSAELIQQELDFLQNPTQHTPVDIPHEKPAPEAEEPADLPPLEDASEKVRHSEAVQSAQEIAAQVAQAAEGMPEYEFPPVSLLRQGRGNPVDGTSEMQENSHRLADTLKSFGIEPHIVNVTRGPSVTRYEIELERGVKLAKITGLADDIALSLGTTGVRISAIPDRLSVVGIEVPNKQVATVCASEVIDSATFRKSKSDLSFAVGKDISGNCIVGDIARLPHLLIAGTTGSGKSVCMNTLIVSLLYKSKPEDVRFIMIDPKMVEFSIYDGIPHLLVPVVKDAKKAAGALQWAVTEMMRRYRLMSEKGVRDLDSYNKVLDEGEAPMEKIVVLIDELSDLMMVAAKEVEDSICRIAQMGRASGIHLVIATQRPSANVITGLMKANIPSRIAFAVASAMESRIILDNAGAEKLIGRGDMLYAPLGQGKPKRVQGCFISDDEVAEVVSFIKESSQTSYSTEVLEQMEKQAEKTGHDEPDSGMKDGDDDADELLPNAVEVLLEIGQASTSMLQRRLKLGYARAARIMDQLEERGIVGPYEGSKPRQLLITKEQWAQMQGMDVPPAVEDEIP